jgi:secreted trypsin-like serine protease
MYPSVVGGKKSQPWPWMVALQLPERKLCGGVILSKSFILTGAHCIYNVKATNVSICAGTRDRLKCAQTMRVKNVISHPEYVHKNESGHNTLKNDIALLHLSQPLDMSHANIARVCLPEVESTNYPPSCQFVEAIGW